MSATPAPCDPTEKLRTDLATAAAIPALTQEAETALQNLAAAVARLLSSPLRRQQVYLALAEAEAAGLAAIPGRLERLDEVFGTLYDDAKTMVRELEFLRDPPGAWTGAGRGDASKAPGEP
jgi:hypothetical protein